MEGAYKKPTSAELSAMIAEDAKAVNGQVPANANHGHYIPRLEPKPFYPLPYPIRPSVNGISTYRIFFTTRNGEVQETLDVRFNSSQKFWQYKYEIKSERDKDANQVIDKIDLDAQEPPRITFGEGRPQLVFLKRPFRVCTNLRCGVFRFQRRFAPRRRRSTRRRSAACPASPMRSGRSRCKYISFSSRPFSSGSNHRRPGVTASAA
jgi:hypothetical protein